MKKIFTLSAIMIFATILSAQRGGTDRNNSNEYSYNDNYNDDYRNDRTGSEYRNSRGSILNNSKVANKYKRRQYKVRFNQLSYRDQKRITKLERSYVTAENKALRNGHLSNREAKYLRTIERDIDKIWSKYERNRNIVYNSCY